jgi:hypothetical protein
VTVVAPARRRRQLVALWLGAAVFFVALLAIARASESGLDDPDPAWQRPGFLDAGSLPQSAPRLSEDLPRPGRPAVAFFVRPDGLGDLCRSLARHRLRESVDLVIVASGSGRCAGVPTLEDPTAGLARAYGLRTPRNGKAPVGYAVVDDQGRIRYRTLDPAMAEELDEVETMVEATR